jgi:hypothetical protein
MGMYRFERQLGSGAGRDASACLEDDVGRALQEIDWVEDFSIQADASDETQVCADLRFEVDWPDARAANPDLVAAVFRRFGLRTLPNPAVIAGRTVAADPLSADADNADDADDEAEIGTFLLEE